MTMTVAVIRATTIKVHQLARLYIYIHITTRMHNIGITMLVKTGHSWEFDKEDSASNADDYDSHYTLADTNAHLAESTPVLQLPDNKKRRKINAGIHSR